MRIGFIGLGSQGGPMARRIAEAGYEMTPWARRAATLEPFADTAAQIAGSPRLESDGAPAVKVRHESATVSVTVRPSAVMNPARNSSARSVQ
jgi:3-hydroxyisobutyrate dehydrogenase-like beta-hydroxyacid dehydrogenase